MLAECSRGRLKELCAALGLDDSGREKAVLIERLAGAKAPEAGKQRRGQAAAPTVELPAAGKLTVDQLERHLWSAADILRGSIDSSDYKNFIFGTCIAPPNATAP